jgi:adenosylcobinamide kinase/adenosylcobinamide-phosphate guanylyltransferase
METASLIFISGGVRSGKSSFAEKKALERAANVKGFLHYLATGVPSDVEMIKRIERHQKERDESSFSWRTWEQSTNIGILAPFFKERDVVLLDCMTTLLSNEMYSQTSDLDEALLKQIFQRLINGIKDIQKNCNQLIVVSNEVLYEPYSDNRLVLTYYRMIGHLHQEVVKIADEAYLVEAGIPILMKGKV